MTSVRTVRTTGRRSGGRNRTVDDVRGRAGLHPHGDVERPILRLRGRHHPIPAGPGGEIPAAGRDQPRPHQPPAVLGCFDQLIALIHSRTLTPVTLDEMFGTSRAPAERPTHPPRPERRAGDARGPCEDAGACGCRELVSPSLTGAFSGVRPILAGSGLVRRSTAIACRSALGARRTGCDRSRCQIRFAHQNRTNRPICAKPAAPARAG